MFYNVMHPPKLIASLSMLADPGDSDSSSFAVSHIWLIFLSESYIT